LPLFMILLPKSTKHYLFHRRMAQLSSFVMGITINVYQKFLIPFALFFLVKKWQIGV